MFVMLGVPPADVSPGFGADGFGGAEDEVGGAVRPTLPLTLFLLLETPLLLILLTEPPPLLIFVDVLLFANV